MNLATPKPQPPQNTAPPQNSPIFTTFPTKSTGAGHEARTRDIQLGKLRPALKSLHLALTGVILAYCAPQARALEILLIGDSITLGQVPYLAELLPEFAITPPPENGRTIGYKLDHLETFLMGRDWDIIYLNSGLHDMVLHTNTTAYTAGLRDLLDALRPRCRALVWGRTTATNLLLPHPRADLRVQMFNAAADAVIAEYGIPSVDLYAATPRAEIIPDGVHFHSAGYLTLAETTAESLRHAAADLQELPRVPVAGPLGLFALAAALLFLAFRLLT